MMKKELYLTILYDYYSPLLSLKQRKYFESYYFDNLSLGEISINLNVSRNAIHKQLKKIAEILINYEKMLNLYEKDEQIKKILEKVTDKELKQEIEEILKI